MKFKVHAWVRILPCVEGRSITEICKELDITYAHVLLTVRDFESAGLVKVRKNGRENRVTLTKKGVGLKWACIELNEIRGGG